MLPSNENIGHGSIDVDGILPLAQCMEIPSRSQGHVIGKEMVRNVDGGASPLHDLIQMNASPWRQSSLVLGRQIHHQADSICHLINVIRSIYQDLPNKFESYTD